MIELSLILGTIVWSVLTFCLITKFMGALQNLTGAVANLNTALPLILDAINKSKTNIPDADVQAQVDSLNIAIGTINNALAAPAAPAAPDNKT